MRRRRHRHTRLTLDRFKLELRRSIRPAIVIAIGIAAAVATLTYIAVRVSPGLTKDTFTAKFAVSDATGVVKGVDEVRVLGVPAGRITKVEMVGTQPVITADIETRYGPIHRDARAALRPVTALQDMYLDIIDPGTARAGRLDDAEPLAPRRTTTSVNIADILNVFRADVRTSLRSLLSNLGKGLDDNGAELRAAFAEIVPLLDVANRTARQLAARRPITERLVHNGAVLTKELARSQRQLRTLAVEGNASLGTLARGADDLDATLRGLPPTLQAIDRSFDQLRPVLGDVDTAVARLRPVAAGLNPALSALTRLSADARPAVRALREPVGRLVPLTQDLAPLSRQLSAAVEALRPQIRTIDKVTRNLAGCKKGIQGFFQWNASMSKYGDVRGPVPRGNVVAGAQSTGLLSDPSEYAPQACTPGTVIGGRLPARGDEH